MFAKFTSKKFVAEICGKVDFIRSRLIEICWSGLCIFPTRHHIKTSKHDGKPQKLHLNKQIKIGLWRVKYKLVLAAQTLSPFPRRSDLYGLPSSVAACRDTILFVLAKHLENLDIKSRFEELTLVLHLFHVGKRWMVMINGGCRAHSELERGVLQTGSNPPTTIFQREL